MPSSLVVEIPIEAKPLAPYEQFGQAVCDEITDIAAALKGRKIWHINSTEKGGGVAELLKSQVALEKGLGIDSHWLVIRPSAAFFDVTKKIHHLLQGAAEGLTAAEEALYMAESEEIGRALQEFFKATPADFIVVHDPQPLVAAGSLMIPKVLRLHVDLCQPNPNIMAWLCEKVTSYSQAIVSRQDCTLLCLPAIRLSSSKSELAGVPPTAVTTIPPAIDPLMPKNIPLPAERAAQIVRDHGIDTDRPIIVQVSRFDQWKDPIGVIQAYRVARKSIPDLQLVLVGFFQADDDADSQRYFEGVKDEAGSDPDIHLFAELTQLRGVSNDDFINALQTGSDVVLQKSLKEGFGLTVTEAMWKGKAVIGGDAGGIRLQIESGTTGIIVGSVAETAEAIVQLLSNDRERVKMGEAAKRAVQAKFLMPRFVRDNLLVYQQCLAKPR